MNVVTRLSAVAAQALKRGQPSLFKRLIRASAVLAKHDTDEELADGIEEDHGGVHVEDSPEEDEDEDTEALFRGFPAGALPIKERRRGPHPKDVAVGKPDWWNPR